MTEWCERIKQMNKDLKNNENSTDISQGSDSTTNSADTNANASANNNEVISVNMNNVGVSIITPPGVTKLIIEEGCSLGIKHFYLQPGTYDSDTDEYINMKKNDSGFDLNIVKSCVLIDLGFNEI